MIIQIEVLKNIALKAGEFIRSADGSEHTEKTNAKDFVTLTDIKVQDMIRKELNQHFPGAMILSEEDPEDERAKMYEADFTGFVLDPIDGTYSFKRDIRESAISIGYVEKGEPTTGVIYDPYKDEMYEVEKGKGARRNGKAISVNNQKTIQGASIATSNSYDDEAMARNLQRHLGIYNQTGIMPWTTCAGSGVLIMAYVACGRFDAYHHNGLKPWDNATAFLLVREAGGVIKTLTGEDASFTSPTVLMGNAVMVEKISKVFSKLPAELLV